MESSHSPPRSLKDDLIEIFNTYFKLGYTTFGGPAAHIAILYDDIVGKWLPNEQFTELFAICQALPGPASTELAYSLALVRIPGAIVMTVVGVLIGSVKGDMPLWALRLEQGLASAAIGLVALAAYRMSTTLATDKLTRILALVSGSVSALYEAPWLLPVMMIAGGLISFVFDAFWTPMYTNLKEKRKRSKDNPPSRDEDLEQGHGAKEPKASGTGNSDVANESSSSDPRQSGEDTEKPASVHSSLRNRGRTDSAPQEKPLDDIKVDTTFRPPFTYSKKLGAIFFFIFLALLIAAILVRALVPTSRVAGYGHLVSTFYIVGSIIFGGGPVIIPLLQTYTVASGWMSDQQFVVGLALIQSLPGPNFNFACFLGAVAMVNANGSGVAGAALCYLAIFFPGLILKNAIIPFWQYVREHSAVKKVFRGVNACALGLVFSATWLLWIQTNALGGSSGYHGVIASAAFVASGYLDVPSPLVIILGGAMGAIEYAVNK
ncbi:hypothetical protein BGX34_006069 [Mortierella sp. NVP85]|nr:hypothetical protein BGX34_006069 [Mortierella sp. NVP85]